MSEATMSEEATESQQPQVSACPITAEFLPEQMRKHVDPKAPVPLRMMAAKGLVPLAPSDMISVLFMLMYDAEAKCATRRRRPRPACRIAPQLRLPRRGGAGPGVVLVPARSTGRTTATPRC